MNARVKVVSMVVSVVVAGMSRGELLLEYKFNETGTQAAGTGALALPAELTESNGNAADKHSADGEGITGQPGDRALDLNDATGMGEGYIGGKAVIGYSNAYDGLVSVTVCGWLRPYVPLQMKARVLDGSNYWVSAAADAMSKDLHFQVSSNGLETGGDAFRDEGKWVFFAVVLDTTAAGNNMYIYRGATRTAVELQYEMRGEESQISTFGEPLVIGNIMEGTMPFNGLMDNVRVYGSKTDGSGALSAAQIEAIRAADGALPEYPLLAEFKFNEDGGYIASNTGSTTTEAEMRWASGVGDSTGVLSNLHTASGGGVSGFAGDRAFDNSGADKMGNDATNCGWAQQVSEDNELDNLKSFTLQGWFNPVTKIDANPGLFLNQSGNYGYNLSGNRSTVPGSLLMSIGDGTAYSTNTPSDSFAETGTWVFFAATFDGPNPGGGQNVHFYKGTRTTPVTLVLSATLPPAQTGGESQPLRLGHQRVSNKQRPFRGLLDNMRIYGSKLDSSGVLTSNELEQVRQSDLAEPVTIVVTPPVVQFGDVVIGEVATGGVFVINAGMSALSGMVSGVSAPFSMSTGSPYELAAGATGSVTFVFAPAAEGGYTNTVSFSGGGGTTARLIGSGVPEPGMVVALGLLGILGSIGRRGRE